jgi:hypothetical protein
MAAKVFMRGEMQVIFGYGSIRIIISHHSIDHRQERAALRVRCLGFNLTSETTTPTSTVARVQSLFVHILRTWNDHHQRLPLLSRR